MRVHRLALFALALSCGGGATPAAVDPDGAGSAQTGLEGTAYRSPTRPVCQVDEPCRAPLTATFDVRQGEQVVARFRSDPVGHFQISIAPGTYTVVPDASAPLLVRSQIHQVTVGPSGLTHVDLDFDTGIR